MSMYSKALNVLTGVGLSSIFSFIGFSVIIGTNPSVNLDKLRQNQESAIVRKYAGTIPLEEMLRNEGFQINHDLRMESTDVLASVNTHDALANACESREYSQSSVCQDYSRIPAAVAAQEKINSQNAWRLPVSLALGSLGASSVAVLGVLPYIRPREQHGQTENGQPLNA